MKKLLSLVTGLFISIAVLSQTYPGTLTIVLKGNNNRQVLVDGRDYTPSGLSTLRDATVTITDLKSGQHELQVIRYSGTYNSDYNDDVRTSFMLRDNFDKTIVVTTTGSLQQNEVRARFGAGTKTAMSSYEFSTLLSDVNASRGMERRELLQEAFEDPDNYFTTAQTRQLLQTMNSETFRLQLAKTAYRAVTDPWNYSQVYDLFTSTRRTELANYVNAYRPVNPDPVYRTPMSDAAFNSLYQNTRNMYSNARKVRNLENAFNNAANYFTTNQAQQLILLTRNESDRLALAKLSYNRITDRNNFATIYNVLNSQSSRNELSAWVNAQGGVTYTPVTPVRTPMSASTFNSLYSSVQYTFGLGAKYSKLTDIFNNSSYNMTTDQAERLIRLVSSESNRLQLAKLGYDNLTDPQNVNQMYDMFDRQSSRDELEAYVRTQPTTTPTQYPYGTTYRVPMSETDYGVLYTDISNRFGLGVKYSALTDAFSNTNNYFTVAQSEQLIRLVSLEENRLQLAKLAYARITDPERISDLYDMFASQASVDELRVYISSR